MAQQNFANVWDALEKTPAAAARMTIRSTLLIAIEQKVESWKVTNAVAARRLGITQPRLNDLLRGKINKFTLDMLIGIAFKADLKVRLKISEAAKAAYADGWCSSGTRADNSWRTPSVQL